MLSIEHSKLSSIVWNKVPDKKILNANAPIAISISHKYATSAHVVSDFTTIMQTNGMVTNTTRIWAVLHYLQVWLSKDGCDGQTGGKWVNNVVLQKQAENVFGADWEKSTFPLLFFTDERSFSVTVGYSDSDKIPKSVQGCENTLVYTKFRDKNSYEHFLGLIFGSLSENKNRHFSANNNGDLIIFRREV